MTALLSVLLIAAMVGPLGILWLAESRLQGHRTDLAILERRMERLDRDLTETLGGVDRSVGDRLGRSEPRQSTFDRIARGTSHEENLPRSQR
jgi:hypothetical protein